MQRSGSGRWPRGGTADRGDASTGLGGRRPFHRRLPRRPGTRVSVHPRGGGVRLTVAGASAERRGGEGRRGLSGTRPSNRRPTCHCDRRAGRPGRWARAGQARPRLGDSRAARQPRPSPDGQLGSRAGRPAARGNRCARRGGGGAGRPLRGRDTRV